MIGFTSNDIMPCPFCGGEARIINPFVDNHDVLDVSIYVFCTECYAQGPRFKADLARSNDDDPIVNLEKAKKLAVQHWNSNRR